MATELSNIPLTDSVVAKDKILGLQGNEAKLIEVEKIAAFMKNENIKAVDGEFGARMMDGARIMHHKKENNYPYLATYDEWPSIQDSGEVADGVFIISGGRQLVIAPNGTSLKWSSKEGVIDNTTPDRQISMFDYKGKEKTKAIVSSAIFGGDGDTYAPGWCDAYSRVNENGKGLTAGGWWLPAFGELLFIFENLNKINKCLSVIAGADLIPASYHWSSSETSAVTAWRVSFGNGSVCSDSKTLESLCVRPVSALIV